MKVLYAAAVFTSALLLFEVEPMIAKIIVPWFGGAASVWTCCLLFFQVLLLAGYLYAHWLTGGFGPKTQAWIHITLLAISLLTLPILPTGAWKPTGFEDPTFRILLLLGATVGLPFFLLSSTSPLLQAWYARTPSSPDPYRFFALSNLGSMLALLSYPVLVEPAVSTRHQAMGWSIAYAGVAVLCGTVAVRSPGRGDAAGESTLQTDSQPEPAEFGRPDWTVRLLWVGLPACASALLLAVTNQLTQNVAAIPLLWVVPLALYLLSFILCFEGHAWYRPNLFLRLMAVALGAMAYALAPQYVNAPLSLLIPLFSVGLFICSMACHGELARLKPPARHLTSFYLMVSLGGALGGAFVALLAPRIFADYYELPISLVGCAVLVLAARFRDPVRSFYPARSRPAWLLAGVLVAALGASLVVSERGERFGARLMVRNFYGVLRVVDFVAPQIVFIAGPKLNPADDSPQGRELFNGTIKHGVQFLAPARRRQPTTYYGPSSGAGLALSLKARRGPMRVGVIGLGVGTLAAYGRQGDQYTFYEINPLVVKMARTQFSFLSDSPAQISVILGDARLSLERQEPQAFDVLAVDAFSSDAIPIHLLTREAFRLYFRHLKPDGVLAVHISNKYLNLAPVVAEEAAFLGKPAIEVSSAGDDRRGVSAARWVLVTGDTGFLDQPETRHAGKPVEATNRLRLWTDDYSSVFSLLN